MSSEKRQIFHFEYEAPYSTSIESILDNLEDSFENSERTDEGLYLESSVGASAEVTYKLETRNSGEPLVQGTVTGSAPVTTRIRNYLDKNLEGGL